jgi:hypothetical protein
MPRALTRDEQTVLQYIRRTDSELPLPVPEIAQAVSLPVEAVQQTCEYLVERGFLKAAIYAVSLASR